MSIDAEKPQPMPFVDRHAHPVTMQVPLILFTLAPESNPSAHHHHRKRFLMFVLQPVGANVKINHPSDAV